MSYESDIMRNLSFALRDTQGLKQALKKFNENAPILEKLVQELERANNLKELELGIDKNKHCMEENAKETNIRKRRYY